VKNLCFNELFINAYVLTKRKKKKKESKRENNILLTLDSQSMISVVEAHLQTSHWILKSCHEKSRGSPSSKL
jgi:hypothetical protein